MSDDRSNRRDAPPGGASRRFAVDPTRSVDEVWLEEWAAEGIERLGLLLAVHAAFDEYLASRDNGGDGDDGR